MRAAPRFVTNRRIYYVCALLNSCSAFVHASLNQPIPATFFCLMVWAFVGLALTEKETP